MAAAVLAVVASAAGGLIIKAARMYTVKYGPQRAAQGAELVEDGYHERDFVRLKALREHNGYTEEEYLEALGETERQQAGEDVDLIEFSYDDNDEEEAKDFIQSAATALGRLPTAAPKSIRVFCMTIRMSRELKGTEVFTGPIPLFAHWNIEVGPLLMGTISLHLDAETYSRWMVYFMSFEKLVTVSKFKGDPTAERFCIQR